MTDRDWLLCVYRQLFLQHHAVRHRDTDRRYHKSRTARFYGCT